MSSNDALAELDPSSMTVGSLPGSGTVQIDSGSYLEIVDSASAHQTITFTAPSGELKIDQLADTHALVSGFTSGDTINLARIASDPNGRVSPVTADDFLPVFDGGNSYELGVSGDCAGDMFQLAPRCVERDVADGRSALLLGGNPYSHFSGRGSVRMLGRRRHDRRRIRPKPPGPLDRQSQLCRPVPGCQPRHAANPFPRRLTRRRPAPSRPTGVTRARHVPRGTADPGALPAERKHHHAGARAGAVDYYHVELDSHDILLAEGAPSESYLTTTAEVCFTTLGSSRRCTRMRPRQAGLRAEGGRRLRAGNPAAAGG